MALADLVSITISRETAAVSRQGFGTALILGVHQNTLERVKLYAKSTYATEMVADGFATDDAIYKAVAAYFSQSPSPSQVYVGRINATEVDVTVDTANNATLYGIGIESVTPGTSTSNEYTSDADATVTEIAAGLAAAINAGAEAANVTATPVAGVVTIAADGTDPFVVTLTESTTLMTIGAPGGTVEDADDALLACNTENSDWYAICAVDRTTAQQALVASWTEANSKLAVLATADANVISQNEGTDTTSIAQLVKNASYARVAVIYSGLAATTYADAALLGRCLSLDAGSITWAYKALAGITPDSLTATERSRILAKNATAYETVSGVSVTQFGTTGSGEFIDTTRGIDWLQSTMQADIYTRLVQQDKIPYTDGGISSIEALIRAALEAGIDRGFLASITSVTVPTAAGVSAANKASRTLQDLEFVAVLAGAIHIIEITGVVTV